MDRKDLETVQFYLVESAKHAVLEWQQRRRVPTFFARLIEIGLPLILGSALFIQWQDSLVARHVEGVLNDPTRDLAIDWKNIAVEGKDLYGTAFDDEPDVRLPTLIASMQGGFEEGVDKVSKDLSTVARRNDLIFRESNSRELSRLHGLVGGADVALAEVNGLQVEFATRGIGVEPEGAVVLSWHDHERNRGGELREYVLVCSTDQGAIEDAVATRTAGELDAALTGRVELPAAERDEHMQRMGGLDFDLYRPAPGRSAVALHTVFYSQEIPWALLFPDDVQTGGRLHCLVGAVEGDRIAWSDPVLIPLLRQDSEGSELPRLGRRLPLQGALARIGRSGQLRVGIRKVPRAGFCTWTSEDGLDGLEPWIVDEVAKLLEDDLERPVEPVYRMLNWNYLFSALGNGEVDVILSTISRTSEREELYDLRFTDSYFSTSQALVRRVDSEPFGFAHLAGKTIGCSKWTTSERCARELARALPDLIAASASEDASHDVPARPALKVVDATIAGLIELVSSGEIDTAVIDYALATKEIQPGHPRLEVVSIEEAIRGLADGLEERGRDGAFELEAYLAQLNVVDSYCLAVQARDGLLRRVINHALADEGGAPLGSAVARYLR
ncbi:MAG: transporter substrate-binding domain-containing protein [Planctomycetota bacterium]